MPPAQRQSTFPKLETAYIKIMEPTSPAGNAVSHQQEGGTAWGRRAKKSADVVYFKFNPKQYTVSKSAQWSRTTSPNAEHAGPLQWLGAEPRRLDLEVFLDESDSTSGDIRHDAELLFTCCEPTAKTRNAGDGACGPFVLFGWGSTMSFTAVVTSVSVTYTMFHPTGIPYRATASVSLEEVDSKQPRQNPTSGTLEVHRSHTVVAGDTLPLLAHAEYKDASAWRRIADANGIDDPLRLRSGTVLLLPALRNVGEERAWPARG